MTTEDKIKETLSAVGMELYEWDYWKGRLGGALPVERIAYKDKGEGYSRDEMSVYKLENGQFVTILEQGCSCYDHNDAQIELFPLRELAMKQFDQWKVGDRY